MSTIQRISLSLGAVLVVLCGGCMGSRGTAQNTYEGDDRGLSEESLGDHQLAKELVMENLRTRRKDQRLSVQFNLRNTRPSNLNIEWTIVWFDNAGFQLDTPRHWTPAFLGGKGFATITRTAPTPEAAEFRLGVRKPNTVRR